MPSRSQETRKAAVFLPKVLPAAGLGSHREKKHNGPGALPGQYFAAGKHSPAQCDLLMGTISTVAPPITNSSSVYEFNVCLHPIHI